MVELSRDAIFVTVAGSHAQGTAREASDLDLRGVCIAPLEDRLSLFGSFSQFEGPLEGSFRSLLVEQLRLHPTARFALEARVEAVIFDLAKFLNLCAAANPNALEILFADPCDWVYETPAWRRLHGERQRFLSRKVQQTYLGYAVAQLRKIKTHRSWLLDPPSRKPTREQFGLPSSTTLTRDDQNRIEQAIAAKLRGYGVEDLELPKATRIALEERLRTAIQDVLVVPDDEIEERMRAVATHALTLPPAIVGALNAERRYRAAAKHWESYETWKAERNPTRAELERQHGYDTKHAMHLVRLMRTGLELLQSGELQVRRSDAAELEAIRNGALSFTELEQLAADLQGLMELAAPGSMLPADVDYQWVDQLAIDLIRERDAVTG